MVHFLHVCKLPNAKQRDTSREGLPYLLDQTWKCARQWNED